MRKKIFMLFVCAVFTVVFTLLFSVTASAAMYSGDCGDNGNNVTWSLDTDSGILTISGNGRMAGSEEYSYAEMTWKQYNDYIKKVIIEKGIIAISNVAFSGCKNLTSIALPNGIEKIPDSMLCGTKIKSITIPASVKKIGVQAFAGCSQLESVNLSYGVESIDAMAFDTCTALKSINIPKSVTYIAEFAFIRCKSLEKIDIPSNVTRIGGWAFSDCTSLKTVTIPSSVSRIYPVTFRSCESLTSITIPHSVIEIGDDAFEDCISLSTVYYTGTEAQWNNIDVIPFTLESTTIKMSQFKDSPLVKAKWVHLHTEKWVTESERTCTTDGVKHMSCTVCNESKIEIIVDKAWGHKFGEWKITAEPSYETGGIEERVCSECGASERREIEKLPTVDTETNTDDVFATDTLYCDDTLESQQNGNGEDSSKPLESDNDPYVEDDDYGISRAENEGDNRVMIIICTILAVTSLGLGITLAIVLLKKGK